MWYVGFMKNDIVDVSDEVVLASELAKEVYKEKEQTYYSFGHPTLDKAVSQISGGDFIALGGSAAGGKTAFCISLTKNLAKDNVPVLWFSIELTPREFLKKFSDVPENIQTFYVPRKIKEPTMSWIESKIDEAIEKFGVKIIFLDHIGMIVNERDLVQFKNGLEIFDERLKQLKNMAVQKNIAIVGIFPVTQETSKRGRKEPTYSDFRGSSMISHASDLILFIERGVGIKNALTLNEQLDWEGTYNDIRKAKLWILKCRRTGMMKANVAMYMDENGDFREE